MRLFGLFWRALVGLPLSYNGRFHEASAVSWEGAVFLTSRQIGFLIRRSRDWWRAKADVLASLPHREIMQIPATDQRLTRDDGQGWVPDDR